jgi:hypothetical protein
MSNRFNIVLFLFISFSIQATTSLNGMIYSGNFDKNDILDSISCNENNNLKISCNISYNQKPSIKLFEIDNDLCDEMEIINTNKGEIEVSCSFWGINNYLYFNDNKKTNNDHNWYLVKIVSEEMPMNGPDSQTVTTEKKFDFNKFNINQLDDLIKNLSSNKQIRN